MIPDLAVVVATYAVARLLNEYVLESDKLQPLRVLVAVVAIFVIGIFLMSILDTAGSASDFGL